VERNEVKRNDIAALLESLCEQPLAERQAEPSPELAALCREAAKALRQDGAARSAGGDIIDPDTLTAALAALLSGARGEVARRTVADAVRRSAAARLDAQSALTFVGAIAHSLQSAPARLVDEMLACDVAGAAPRAAPPTRAGIAQLWSLIVGRSQTERRWRLAALCTVLLMAGVAPIYRMQTNPAMEGGAPPAPAANAPNKPSAVVDVPAQPQRALAKVQPCEPRAATTQAMKAPSIAPTGAPTDAPTPAISMAIADCAPAPARELSDHAATLDRPALGTTDRKFPMLAPATSAARPATPAPATPALSPAGSPAGQP
jgi:hypothetical protein